VGFISETQTVISVVDFVGNGLSFGFRKCGICPHDFTARGSLVPVGERVLRGCCGCEEGDVLTGADGIIPNALKLFLNTCDGDWTETGG
jgi:hypothetical protein